MSHSPRPTACNDRRHVWTRLPTKGSREARRTTRGREPLVQRPRGRSILGIFQDHLKESSKPAQGPEDRVPPALVRTTADLPMREAVIQQLRTCLI